MAQPQIPGQCEIKYDFLSTSEKWLYHDIIQIDLSDIQKDEEIYLYCRSGNRSGKATQILLEAGYINAKNAGSIFDASELLGIKIID